MATPVRPLVEVLAEIPDFRKRRGLRHPLVAVLTLVCVGLLCNYDSYGAISAWGADHGERFLSMLGFTAGRYPCASTLFNVLKGIDRKELEAKLKAWAEGVLAALPAPEDAVGEVLAADGKTLRGSRKQGMPAAHLLCIVSHRLGLSLGQQAVSDKTNEIPVLVEVLKGLVLEGRVLTVDALLTQREIAQTIVDKGGDYVMTVKENQPGLRADIKRAFQEPKGTPMEVATDLDFGHGRIERRTLTTTSVLAGYADWPGLEQIYKLERKVTSKKTGRQTCEVVYGVTSLSGKRAGAEQLLACNRGHWCIENRVHWVRDVTFDEDRSQTRCGSVPQVLAAFRNLVIGLMRIAGHSNVAAGRRRYAAKPHEALGLLGIAADY